MTRCASGGSMERRQCRYRPGSVSNEIAGTAGASLACIAPPAGALLTLFSHGIADHEVALHFVVVVGGVHIHPLPALRPMSDVFEQPPCPRRRLRQVRTIVEPSLPKPAHEINTHQVPFQLPAPGVEDQ